MTVLSTFLNGASHKDMRDTWNVMLADIAVLKAGTGTPTPTPAPSFTTSTSISSDGTPQVGETLTGNDGAVTGGTVTARQWLLGSTAISGATGTSYVPTQTGNHSYRVTATGPGGTTSSTGTVTVAAAGGTPTPTPAPAFTASPTINSDGTPQVGETLTGVDGTVSNGTVISRRWLFGGSQVATTANYAPTQTGVHTFENTASGAGGSATASTTVTVAAAGAAPITFASRQGWDQEDNFDGTPEALVNRPGWSATTNPSWKVRNSSAYKDGKYDPTKFASFGTAVNQNDNVEFEVEYNRTGIDPTEGSPVGNGQTHYSFVTDDAENGAGSTIGFDGYTFQIAPKARWSQRSSGNGDNGPNMPVRGKFKVRLQGGFAYAAFNDRWLTYSLEDYTDFQSKTRTGTVDGVNAVSRLELGAKTTGRPIGFSHSTWGNPVADGVRVRQLKVHVIDLDRFCSRRATGALGGDIRINGWFTGTASRWVYRLLLARTGALVQDFRDLDSQVISGNAWSGKMSVPVGGPYYAEIGYIGPDNILYSDNTRFFSCGRKIAIFGQSNAGVRIMRQDDPEIDIDWTGGAAQTAEESQWKATTIYGNGTGEYGLSIGAQPAAIQLARHLGEPCCIIGTAQAASGLDQFLPGDEAYIRLATYLNRVPGILDAIIHDGHENNSDSVGGDYSTGRIDYFNQMKDEYIPGIRTIGDTPSPDVKFFLAPPGRYASNDPTNGPNGPWANTDFRRDQLKLAVLDLENTPGLNVRVSSAKNGVDHGTDAYHYMGGEQGSLWMTRRDCQTIANAFKPSVPDGRGPLHTGLTREANGNLTIAMNKNGAATLTGFLDVSTGTRPLSSVYKANTFKGYQFSYTPDFATLIPISSMTVNSGASTVTVVPVSPANAKVYMRYLYGCSWDDREMIYGAGYADGRRDLPAYPVYVPLTSN